MLVPESGCTACGNVSHFYNPKKSCGKDLHRKVNETYNGGNVTGKLYQDTVSIAGLTVRFCLARERENQWLINICQAKGQTFVAVTDYPEAFTYSHDLDGFLGLAFPSLSPIQATPLLQNLFKEKQIPDAVFGVSLAPNCPELYLGGTNSKYSDRDFAYFNVLPKVRIR